MTRLRRAAPWFILSALFFMLCLCSGLFSAGGSKPSGQGDSWILPSGSGSPVQTWQDDTTSDSGNDSGSWWGDWGWNGDSGSDSGSWDGGGLDSGGDSGSWDWGGSDSGSWDGGWDSGGSDSGSW